MSRISARIAAVRLRHPLAALLVACALWGAPHVHADEGSAFQLTDKFIRLVDTNYLLDAQFSIILSPGAREALENGVPLVFELQVQLVRTHPWFWDKVAAEITFKRELQYNPLSRSYLVKDVRSTAQSNYLQLDDALLAAGNIRDLIVIQQSRLDRDRLYKMRVRGNLDIESLPTPVRLLAYVSSAWDMRSEWYAWPFAR
jgi:hypothetical protein